MMQRRILAAALAAMLCGPAVWAVTSQIHRLDKAADLLAGKADQVRIDSQGRIMLGRRSETIETGDLLGKVWSINAMTVDTNGHVYLGTSPNGDIFRLANGALERLCPTEADVASDESETIKADPVIRNEHVFALTMDKADRLVAGISGKTCRLMRFDGQWRVLFTPEEDRYILSLATDEVGNLYVGTGPHGRIWRLDPFGQNPTLVYTCRDKNVLSLAIDDQGRVYAGCDQRGLVYRIDPSTGDATVIYDSEQEEVAALVFDDAGRLYAAATTAGVISSKVRFDPIAADAEDGKAEPKKDADDTSTTKLAVPNTGSTASDTAGAKAPSVKRGALPKSAGHIYRIDPRGFVTDMFTDMTVFFDMGRRGDELLLATGNEAKLFAIDVHTEDKVALYSDEQSAQITALALKDGATFLGLANPPKLVRLDADLVTEGTYTSDLIDAGQPARWGKLQLDADVPDGCALEFSVRSGNVKDPNDPTFSPWSDPVAIRQAVPLDCPLGRFCQVRLILSRERPSVTPVVRELALSHVVDNLAPKVTQVKAARQAAKPGVFQLAWTATDDNKDTLVYRLEFRRQGREMWIELKDELTSPTFEWDSRTVEDGRYEVRVTADDVRSNTPQTALTASRISDTIVVDNTAPAVEHATTRVEDGMLTLLVGLRDELSVLKSLEVTVDSNEDWIGALPDDGVCDTTEERFTIVLKDLEPGPHVIALKYADHVDNTGYKTLEATIP